jgi:hypothetical protein
MASDQERMRELKEKIRPLAADLLQRADTKGLIPTPLEHLNDHLVLKPVQRLFDPDGLPPEMAAIVQRLRGKVFGAFSVPERSIYVNAALTVSQSKFTLAHEIGHAAIPWHRPSYFGDDQYTLALETKAELEAEANCFASELIFPTANFVEMSTGSSLGLESALKLAEHFDTSIHSTIRHYVEESIDACGLIRFGRYPDRSGGAIRPKIMAIVESSKFARNFGPLELCLPPDLRGGSAEV